MIQKPNPSPGTRILWGQILIVTGVAVLFVWAATQWTAWRLGFQPELGAPMAEVFGFAIHAP